MSGDIRHTNPIWVDMSDRRKSLHYQIYNNKHINHQKAFNLLNDCCTQMSVYFGCFC